MYVYVINETALSLGYNGISQVKKIIDDTKKAMNGE
jgi:hypothetical protein